MMTVETIVTATILASFGIGILVGAFLSYGAGGEALAPPPPAWPRPPTEERPVLVLVHEPKPAQPYDWAMDGAA